jgi:hypothetical protein
MYEWIKSPGESIALLKTLNTKKGYDDNANIDHAQLVNEIKKKLIQEKIPRWLFAKDVLGISIRSFSKMLQRSTPYALCKGYTRKLYRKMHDWIQTPKESIEALKMLTDRQEEEVELDAFELVERVNKLSARLKIRKWEISLILNLSYSILSKLLHDPAPWHLLTKLKKDYYTRIHAWLIQNEDKNISVNNF